MVVIQLIDCSLWFIVMVMTTVLIHDHLYGWWWVWLRKMKRIRLLCQRNCQNDKMWFDGGELLSKRETHIIRNIINGSHDMPRHIHFLISEMNTLKPRISIFANRSIQSNERGSRGFCLLFLFDFGCCGEKNKIDSSKKHNNDKQHLIFFSCLAWSWRFPWAVNWASVNWGESFLLDFFVNRRSGHNNVRLQEWSCNFSIFCSLIRHSL